MDRRAAGALLALAACIASSAAAPTVNNQTALDIYDAASEGCYYNFQHYGEGDRIMTNEPCLNCTCHNRMLMCYLRVCPFTKPIGQDCTVEKRADQCCPIVTCPDVPVDLLTSTSTSSPAEYGATGLGKLDKFGCSINGKYFPEGSKVPPTPNKPCEHCYCIRNMTTCVMQECTLHVDGCTPIYHKDVCCPVRYSCDHPEDEMPLLDDMSTTVRPTPGFLLTTTTISPVTQMTQDCVHNDQIFPDGTSIKTEKACEHCYCMKGDIVCVVQECGTPMENEGKNCTSQPPREGQCCPDTYICEGDEITTELMLDITTESSIEKLTTLIPPRRILDEGSGYRKEEKEPIATELPSIDLDMEGSGYRKEEEPIATELPSIELDMEGSGYRKEEEPIATESPSIEPDIEGSGDDFATLSPSEETEKQTPSLIDEKLPSTEDLIGMNTTPESIKESDISTVKPESELSTVANFATEHSATTDKVTTTSEDVKTSQKMDQTNADSAYTTSSPKEKEGYGQTTEAAFRKEDNLQTHVDITTEKASEEYTPSSFESSKITTVSLDGATDSEPLITVSETKSTTPTLLGSSQTEIVTEIPTGTTSDKSVKESTISFDHTVYETPTTTILDKTETTTVNAQENEIEDISTTQGPSRIPGEGDCLQNGVTYRNESVVPSNNNCLTDCKCISSIIKCDPIICSPPPEYMNNCVPTYDSLESCCPTFVCDGSKETLPPQPHSQMSETPSSTPTPAVECHGDQCEVQKVDEKPIPESPDDCNNGDCASKPNAVPESSNCGTDGCGDFVQTPVQIDLQPQCGTEGCDGSIQTVPQEISPTLTDGCSGSECQPRPTEEDNSLQPCEGDSCKMHPVQPCKNEEECKTINAPEIETPCEGDNCKIPPTQACQSEEECKTGNMSEIATPCEGDNCKIPPAQPCQNEEECKTVNIPEIKTPCEGDNCKIPPAQPCQSEEECKTVNIPEIQTPCEGDNCKISPTQPCQSEEECKTVNIPEIQTPCEGDNCKIPPAQPCQNEEECKTVNIPEIKIPCEGDDCKIQPVQPCQSEEECKTVNILEVGSCEGESCKNVPTKCIGDDCKIPTETEPLCEGEECASKDTCLGEECKETNVPDITGKLPDECHGDSCISKPEKPELLVTESPLSTQGKITEILSTATQPFLPDSTQMPEHEDRVQPSTTEDAILKQTTPEFSSEKPLSDSDDNIEKTDKPSTDLPLLETTEYVQIKETTILSDIATETQTEQEIVTTSVPSSPTVLNIELSQTTKLDDLVTRHPEVSETTEHSPEESTHRIEVATDETKLPDEQSSQEDTFKPEKSTESEYSTKSPTVSSDIKPETDTTQSEVYETTSQPDLESLPKLTSKPILDITSVDEQYTKVSETESGDKTTESIGKETTEVSAKEDEGTSSSPEESFKIDQETTTSSPLEKSTEKLLIDTPAVTELYSTSSKPNDVTIDSIDKKTDMPEEQTQESPKQTTESYVEHKETTVVPTTTQVLSEKDLSDTEKPIDEEKIPDLPKEDIFTEQPEIYTEEPSIVTHKDEAIPEVPIEPENPDYIPVHPTASDVLEPELTPESGFDTMVSTEHTLHLTTPEAILENETEQSVSGIEDATKLSSTSIIDQYSHDITTQASVEILPTDSRKYGQHATGTSEPVTSELELTTAYIAREKTTISPTYSQPSSSESSTAEESHATTPSDSFSTESQENIPTDLPESHVKETEGVKLTITPEITTEMLKPVGSEETQTESPTILEPKPTQSQPTSVESEEEKEIPENDLETDIKITSEYTSEPKFEYSETTPDMIELVEHNELFDVSTLSPTTSDRDTQQTTLASETEKSDEQLTTEKVITPEIEKTSETTIPPHATELNTEDESATKRQDEAITDYPTDKKPDQEITSTPDIFQTQPEHIPIQDTSTEKVEIEKDHSTKQPDELDLEHKTVTPELSYTEKPETTKSDIDERATELSEESVTESKIQPEIELETEKPEMEVKPVKQYTTKIPELEQEITTMVPEEPSISEQSVTDKTAETKEPDVPLTENEIIIEQETVKPTTVPEIQKEVTTEKEMVSKEPEISVTEPELSTESPNTRTIKEPEIESTTVQKTLSVQDIITSTPESPITEEAFTIGQEFVTKEPELSDKELTTILDIPVSEDELLLKPSTEKPEYVELEHTMTSDKVTPTELTMTPNVEIETESPEIIDKVKPDVESSTEIVDFDVDTTKKYPTKKPEPSDIENEISLESTTKLYDVEHKSSTEASITQEANTDQDEINKIEPSTEPTTRPEIDNITEEQAPTTEESHGLSEVSESSQKPTTNVLQTTESTLKPEKEMTADKTEEPFESELTTSKPDVSEDQIVQEITKEPDTSEVSADEHETKPHKEFTTNKPELSSTEFLVPTTELIMAEKDPSITEHDIVSRPELVTEQPGKPETEVKDEEMPISSEPPIDESEAIAKTTITPLIEEYTKYDDKEKLTTLPELSSTLSSVKRDELPEKSTQTTPESESISNKQEEEITKYTTTPGYVPIDETTIVSSKTEKPSVLEEGTPAQAKPETEKPIDTKDTTAPEEEFLTVTTKATPPKVEIEMTTHSEDIDNITKPHETPEESSSLATPEIPKPGFNEVQSTDEVPGPEEENHFAPSATGGYGQEPDYEDENQPFGPGTCRYGGKVYVSAQQIPRDDPCDFCFCFRSDIICLQQSCPPPIHGCHEEPIQGFCCPRYECPVSMTSTLNVTTTTTTTTTTLPPHFLPHAYQGAVQRRGCQIKGHTYKVGEVVRASSGPCLHCTCGGDGQMKCDPKACTPEPMLRQMIAAAVSAKRRR